MGVETFHKICFIKTVMLTTINNRSKQIIFISNVQCASEDAGLTKEVNCEIPHQLEKETKYFL